jgi:restriction endonuclease S subunit
MSNWQDEWEVVALGDVAEIINGRAYKLSEWETSGTPVIRLQNLTQRGGDFYFSNLALPEKQYCTKGDLLYMWSATFGPHIWWGEKAIFHYHIWKIEPNERIDKNFLFYLLDAKTQEWKTAGSGMAMIHLTKAGIEKELLCIPPLPEQKKIAEILSGIEGVIHRRRSLLEKVTLLASRSFNEVIDKIATEHPIATVESVTTKVIDGPHLTPNYQERGVPFVTVKNISSGKLDLTNTKFITADDHADFCMRGKAEHGDILYSKDGSIGHTCVVPKEYDFSFFVSVALLKTNKELIYPEYLNAVLQSTLIKTQTELMSEGSGLKHMVLRSIKALKIPLPPLDEQIRLMAQLLPVFKSREIIEETIQRMAYFREGIASDLLSGRKRVSV